MDGATANARRKYHHVHHGGKLTEHDIAGMVRGMENKDAEIARLTRERDEALAKVAAVIEVTKAALAMGDAGYRVDYNPAAIAALNRVRAGAMREAAGIADKNRDVSGWVARDAILARADEIERGD